MTGTEVISRLESILRSDDATKLRILLVDDDPDIRRSYSKTIKRAGKELGVLIDVITAEDGQDGMNKYIAMLREGRPVSGVVTDLNMPKLSGIDVTREVKMLSPNTPVYVLTAFEDGPEYERLSTQVNEVKPNKLITKPKEPYPVIRDEIIKDIISLRDYLRRETPPTTEPLSGSTSAVETKPYSLRVFYGDLKG